MRRVRGGRWGSPVEPLRLQAAWECETRSIHVPRELAKN